MTEPKIRYDNDGPRSMAALRVLALALDGLGVTRVIDTTSTATKPADPVEKEGSDV